MSASAAIGSVLAGFRVESLIGQGAMGAVYLAEDTATGRQVALKLLAPALAEDERFRERFLRESQLAASLDHPHIVPVLASGDENGVLYLAMAYVAGFDLRELLRREAPLEAERALRIVSEVADALDAAHENGLVHRDVKPGNILVGDDGRASVCDFGLARHVTSVSSLTGDRGFVGTIDYVPPEQIKGGEVDGRADLYALGCVLFECLAGERPFERESELAVVYAHLNEPPSRLSDYRPELSAAFDDVFATALAKAPSERYSTCGELVGAARAALEGRRGVRRKRARRRLLLALAVSIVVVGATIGGTLALRRESSKAAPAITETSIAGAPLGLRVEGYTKILGRPDLRVDQGEQVPGFPSTEYPTLIFLRQKVAVYFPDGWGSRAKIITTWNEDFKTAAGVGPCSTIEGMKAAYGDRVKADHWGTIRRNGTTMHFMYDVGQNLLFAVSGELSTPGKPVPGKYTHAVGLFDGSRPNADVEGGARNFAGFVTGNETPSCVS